MALNQLNQVGSTPSLTDFLYDIEKHWMMTPDLFHETASVLREATASLYDRARNPQFQEELDKVIRVFKRISTTYYYNISAQYFVSCRMNGILEKCFEREPHDLFEAGEFLRNFTLVLKPLKLEQRRMDGQLKKLGDRVTELMVKKYPPAASLEILSFLV